MRSIADGEHSGSAVAAGSEQLPPTGTALRDLEEQGFHTAALLPPELVAELRAMFDQLEVDPGHGFFASSNDLEGEVASAVGAELTRLVGPLVTPLLADHEPFLASFLTKGADRGARVSFHQDLSYTDERAARTVVVWIPLCDVDATNGAMSVVPGSHRWTTGSRAGGDGELPTEPHQERLSALAQLVPLRAGEALFYDAALVHGSDQNHSGHVRPAVGIALVPRGAPLVHVHRATDGTLSAWEVDPSFYTHQSLWARPEGYPEVDVWADAVDQHRIGEAIDGNDRGRPSPPAAGPARVLRDHQADESLLRDGFAVIDLPESVELAAGLGAFYAELHGLEGQGFEPDLVNPDLGYRRRVSEHLSAALDAVVAGRFIDHEPFLRVFLAKWPGPQSDLYLHRDWMYVDERSSGHTYVVWIPLCDVDEANGPLQVLRGSHLIDDSPRGTDLNAPWINHHEVVIPRLETVTARLGQAVVMDNALVHSSLPNHTDRLRLVAAVGLKPAGAPMVHFLRAGDDSAWRYDVDEDFLMTVTPQALMASPPDLPVAEELAAGQRFWSEDDLLVALGEEPAVSEVPSPPTGPSPHVAPAFRGPRPEWMRRLRGLVRRR